MTKYIGPYSGHWPYIGCVWAVYKPYNCHRYSLIFPFSEAKAELNVSKPDKIRTLIIYIIIKKRFAKLKVNVLMTINWTTD